MGSGSRCRAEGLTVPPRGTGLSVCWWEDTRGPTASPPTWTGPCHLAPLQDAKRQEPSQSMEARPYLHQVVLPPVEVCGWLTSSSYWLPLWKIFVTSTLGVCEDCSSQSPKQWNELFLSSVDNRRVPIMLTFNGLFYFHSHKENKNLTSSL